MDYTYKKFKETYTILNNDVELLNYSIYKKDCDSSTLVAEGSIPYTSVVVLPITSYDGIYSVVLNNDTDGTVMLPDIIQFKNTLSMIVDNIENLVCGCKECHDCD